MTYQFPNRVTSPPGGWRYRVPETGQTFEGVNESQLLEMLRAHYRANELEFPANIKDLIEQQICEKHRDYCVDAGGRPPVSPSKMASVAYHLAREYTMRLAGIDKRVTQERANDRAAICVNCTENVPREECTQCNMKVLRDLIVKIVGNRGTPFDDRLHVCRVCLCENKAKIHLSLESLKRLTNKEEWAALPQTCWMKIESENNDGTTNL